MVKETSPKSIVSTPKISVSSLQPFVPVEKKGKRVKWETEAELESIKFFKLTDLPVSTGLTKMQVEEVQKHIANVPSHMVYSELKKLDFKMDRQGFEEQKCKDAGLKV